MEVSPAFKETIKEYLDKRAAEDELFAVTYQKENKSLDECCNYVMKCAQDGGFNGYSDKEVFGWAVHYYDEDDIKNVKPVSGTVIVNRNVELTEEEKAEAREKAKNDFIEMEKDEIIKSISGSINLSDEEKQLTKQIAINNLADEQKSKLVAKKNKKTSEETKVQQVSLF